MKKKSTHLRILNANELVKSQQDIIGLAMPAIFKDRLSISPQETLKQRVTDTANPNTDLRREALDHSETL